jgi:hypothetical protein
MLCLIATYLACFRDWTSKLAPGGKPVVLLIAPTREQAKIDLSYVTGILDASPVLRRLVTNVTANSVELRTGVTIETGIANFRSIRGRSVCVAIIDEAAFLRSDTIVNPDVEVLNAVLPSLGRFGHDGVLLIGSTPHCKSGILYDGYKSYYGVEDGEALCWVAPTRTMNPTYSQALIDAAMAKDPPKASAEYLAEFRDDLSNLFTREVIEGCVRPGIRERGPQSGVAYIGAVDPAAGGADSFTLAISHREKTVLILDAVRERRGSPEAAIADYAGLLKTYGLTTVTGDNYGKDFVVEAFGRHGIAYKKSGKDRSDIYLSMFALVNSGRVELLDGQQKMLRQFMALERKVLPSGKDSINHPESGDRHHDDLANVASLALVLASVAAPEMKFPPVPIGLGRASYTAEHVGSIFADHGTQLPGVVAPAFYGDCSVAAHRLADG